MTYKQEIRVFKRDGLNVNAGLFLNIFAGCCGLLIDYWFGLVFLIGTVGAGGWHGYHEDKLAPAVLVTAIALLFFGFGVGASIKGIVSLFTK